MTDEPTEIELTDGALDAIVEKCSGYVSVGEFDAIELLVAALRSERTQTGELREEVKAYAATVEALEDPASREVLLAESFDPADFIEVSRPVDLRAELERERTQNRELLGVIDNCLSALRAHAEQECEECEGVMEEAERFVARAAPARDPLDIKTGSAGWATRCETYSVTGFRCDKQAGHLDAHESTHGSEATCWLNLAVARGEAPLSTQEESSDA